jgi:hypothetical protein
MCMVVSTTGSKRRRRERVSERFTKYTVAVLFFLCFRDAAPFAIHGNHRDLVLVMLYPSPEQEASVPQV